MGNREDSEGRRKRRSLRRVSLPWASPSSSRLVTRFCVIPTARKAAKALKKKARKEQKDQTDPYFNYPVEAPKPVKPKKKRRTENSGEGPDKSGKRGSGVKNRSGKKKTGKKKSRCENVTFRERARGGLGAGEAVAEKGEAG
jgi:hypothetical protein